MAIISRSKWGARYGDGNGDRPLPATEAWLHHSVTIAPDLKWVDADGDNVDDDEERAMRTIEDIGKSRFGSVYGFPYTFAVMPSGRVYQGHAVGQQGAHTANHNYQAIGIVFVGNYEDSQPTDAQLDGCAWLLRECESRGWLKAAKLNGGHRDTKSTACPGKYAYAQIDEINRRAAAPTEEDDLSEASDRIEKALDYIGRRLIRVEDRVEKIEKGGLAIPDSEGIFHATRATYPVLNKEGEEVDKTVPVGKAVGYNRADIRAMREQLARIEAALTAHDEAPKA